MRTIAIWFLALIWLGLMLALIAGAVQDYRRRKIIAERLDYQPPPVRVRAISPTINANVNPPANSNTRITIKPFAARMPR